jgi:predicted dehydrogenase
MRIQIKLIAIIGLGSIGRRHLRILKNIRPDINVVLVRSGKGKKWPEEQLATLVVNRLSDAISLGIDAAIISSPSIFHAEHAIELIRNKIPTLIEKPLSSSIEDAQAVFKIWEKNKSLVLLGYVLRYKTSIASFKSKLSSEAIGNIESINIRCESFLPKWRPEQDFRETVSSRKDLGGGVLLELSHEFDYASWLFGPLSVVESTLSYNEELNLDVEDEAEVFLKTIENWPLIIYLNFYSSNSSRYCSVKTDKGELKWNLLDNSVSWKSNSKSFQIWEFPELKNEMYTNQIIHFFDCIEKGAKPRISIHDGIEVSKLIDSVHNCNSGG